MKKLFKIALLFAVLTIAHVSFAQDESPGIKVTTENQIQTATLVANPIQILTLSNIASEPTQMLNSDSVYAIDNNVAIQPIKCLSNADYGDGLLNFNFSINKNLFYTCIYKVPAHQTHNCATGYMCI